MNGGSALRFSVLGPWEAVDGGQPVVVPAGQMRVLLAAFLMSPGQPVTVDTLAGRLWPERVPVRVRATLHTYVARLRRLLGHDVIQTTPVGYRFAVVADQVDLWRFRDLLARADASRAASSDASPDASADVCPDAELELLRTALGLWRGRPFTGVESAWLDREVVPRLEDEWFAATERRIELELRAGHCGQLVAELRDLVQAYPTRESLWVRLIEALHGSGRRAEALAAYRRVRGVLTEELGIEPGDALQLMHRRVLRDGATIGGEPADAGGPDAGVIRQLPHDVANFSDRAELAQLTGLLPVLAGAGRRMTNVVAIDGAPGIGKTTLAVHWAHQVASSYPDIQLYLNLHGYGPSEPVSPSAAVETVLRGLGVDSDLIPPGVDERAALLRSRLAGRRVLMLLDNVRTADQVLPLLPGTDSLVIVTSRNQLRRLSIRDGAHRVTLGPLPPDEARALLATVYGADRVAAEHEAATRLVELCAGLPLALAIVAERAQGAGGLTEVVQALVDERAGLDVFGDGDPYADLWAALSWSYRALGTDAAQMFRRLGLHPATDASMDAAAALAGMPVRHARQALDQLVSAHLVQQRRPHRYEMHELIRWYAVEQAGRDESPEERAAAVGRMLDWYLHAAVSADQQLLPHRRRDFVAPYQPRVVPPQFADVAAATAWFEAEYHILRAVIRWAGAHGWGGHAWRTVLAMTAFIERRIPWRDAVEFHEWALAADIAAGEPVGEGYLLNSLAVMFLLSGDGDTAIPHLRQALDRFRGCGHLRGEAMALGNLGMAYGGRGDHATAWEHTSRAVELCQALGYDRGVALNLDNLGVTLAAAGEPERAIDCHRRAEAINRELGEANSEAMNQHHLGCAYAALGRYRPALRAFREAVMRYRGLGNRRLEAVVLVDLGRSLHQAGHRGLAWRIWEYAVATLKEFDDAQAHEIYAAITALDAG